jgi:hypothetical protein
MVVGRLAGVEGHGRRDGDVDPASIQRTTSFTSA